MPRRHLWWFAALCVVIAAVGLVVGAKLPDRSKSSIRNRITCASNLEHLAAAYVKAARQKGHRFDTTLHGSAQVLSWFGDEGIQHGQEHVFFCPCDEDAAPPAPDDRRPQFHPADAAALRAARGLGSYAVRDFQRCPIVECAKNLILCDRQGADGRTMHHENVIVVASDMGQVEWLTRADLGIPPGEPIVVGPDSPCPLLRVFERP